VILIIADVGDSVVVRGTLKDEDGTPITGATVTARVVPPDGTEVNPDVDEEGAGVYSVVLDLDAPRRWAVRLESAAPELAAAEGIVYVRRTEFA
jgi:uncharacterized protein YfaS (alpha-2-macroglobulin family)